MIASGEKTIETRTWRTDYRGLLLVVSSRKPAIAPAGYALATVKLADCRPMEPSDEMAARCACYPGAYAWILQDVRRIKPFVVRGRLGLYDVDMPMEQGPVYRQKELL